MNLTTRCRDCRHNGNCRVKNSLNEVVQKIIKRTEDSVRKETALDMEFIIVTDVSIIPTNCNYFIAKETDVETYKHEVTGLFNRKPLVTV